LDGFLDFEPECIANFDEAFVEGNKSDSLLIFENEEFVWDEVEVTGDGGHRFEAD